MPTAPTRQQIIAADRAVCTLAAARIDVWNSIANAGYAGLSSHRIGEIPGLCNNGVRPLCDTRRPGGPCRGAATALYEREGSFPGRYLLPETFSSTAARIRSRNAASSMPSPSLMSIARRALPSRLELKSFAGSDSDAPFMKVSLTTLL